MSIDALPPGLLLITAALVLAVLKGAARKVLVLAAPLAVLAVVWSQPEGALLHVSFIGHTLVPVKVDALGGCSPPSSCGWRPAVVCSH